VKVNFKNMEKNKIIVKIIIPLILIGLAVSFRLLPHPWNFTPIAAVALFSGVYLGKRYALFVPLLAMFLSDIFLGFYDLKLMLAVYGSFALVGLIGLAIRRRKNPATVLGGSLAASTLFFLITNFAVWQFSFWYEKSLSGLFQCYALALPFFRSALLGDLFYTGVLFGAYEMVLLLLTKREAVLSSVRN
jgi:hypothetical protein